VTVTADRDIVSSRDVQSFARQRTNLNKPLDSVDTVSAMFPVSLRTARFAHRRLLTGLLAVAVLCCAPLAAPPARAASSFSIHGAGDGHGIGMSQYGALGFALHGYRYTEIIGHYYEGTSLTTANPNRTVSVLLQTGASSFSGAAAAAGHALKPGTTYSARPDSGGRIALFAGRHKVGSFAAPLPVSGPGPLDVVGLGRYRGSLELRLDGSGGIETVNSVGLDDYVRGVVAAEMPSSWPTAAIDAQAVAARTYVLTAGAVGADFQVYSDTRSQMYGGVAAETPRTDAAVGATRGQIVTYAGVPATTYFFASSGGHTESIQNVWTGVTPEAWLHGVADPYDSAGGNPYYRWRIKMSVHSAAGHLHGLLKGSLRGIQVTRHGVSPRVITAVVVGTRGRTTVSGSQLQQAFGLMSTYASFTTITTKAVNSASTTAPVTGAPSGGSSTSTGSGATASSSGGATFGNAFRSRPITPILTGSIFPSRPGQIVTVQRLRAGRFTTVGRVRTGAGGSYRATVPGAGRYRIVQAGVAGPAITVA
jgi:stage II sporulation protein D